MAGPIDESIGPATRCDEKGHFAAILRHLEASQTLAVHRRPSQVSPPNSRECGQAAAHDGTFSYSPAMVIAAMPIRNIYRNILSQIARESLLYEHHNAANCFKIG